VRTRRPFFRSRPGSILLWSTVLLVVVATTIPFFPYASRIGFVPLSGALLTSLAVITVGYVAATELVKRLFYRPAHEQRSQRRENTSVAS
jgi:P-type Mg2+ transporter